MTGRCRGCPGVPALGSDGFCRRCEYLQTPRWLIADLTRRGYPYMGAVRRWYRQHVELVDQQRDGEHERRCGFCGGPLPARSTGRPATYCSARCRKRAWEERNRTNAA